MDFVRIPEPSSEQELLGIDLITPAKWSFETMTPYNCRKHFDALMKAQDRPVNYVERLGNPRPFEEAQRLDS